MTLQRLEQVVPPPTAPLEPVASERWSSAEATLGLTLPDDFKQLVDTYGTGMFNDFLTVFVPFAGNKNLNLLDVQTPILDAYRTLAKEHPDTAPFPVFPEPGGLFPYARTDNGDVFYWKTVGEPNSWPTVLFESRHAFYEEFGQPTTELLAGLLDGTITSESFPSPDDFGGDPFFEPRA